MSASYKPVLLLSLLDTVDDAGGVPVEILMEAFRAFYRRRKDDGKIVERDNIRMARVHELSDANIQQLMLQTPFRKFSQRGYLDYGKDVSQVRFVRKLWRRLNTGDKERLRRIAQENIEKYYARCV